MTTQCPPAGCPRFEILSQPYQRLLDLLASASEPERANHEDGAVPARHVKFVRSERIVEQCPPGRNEADMEGFRFITHGTNRDIRNRLDRTALI